MDSGPRIPRVIAVGFWVGSALAVATYTWIALKETASGNVPGQAEKGLVANTSRIGAELEPIPSGQRTPSRSLGISPAQLGFGKNKLTRDKFNH